MGTRFSLKDSGTQGPFEKAHFKMFFRLRKKRTSFSAPLIKDFDQTFSKLISYVQRTHKWTCLSLFRVKKYKMMTSAKERHRAEETCIVTSRD